MTKNYNAINVTALERLPEKHYAHKNWSTEQKTTHINTSEKRKETGGETNISMCNLSANTSTKKTTNKSKVHIQSIVNPVYIHPSFLLHWVTNQRQFSHIPKGLGCSVIRKIIG